MANQSVIKGAIKVQGIPDSACFTNFSELLKALGTYLTVEIANQEFSNVVISVAQPGAADRFKLWMRISSSGSFVGFFVYQNGVWSQVVPAPFQLFILYGDSSNPPTGYSFDLVQTLFSAPDYAELITKYAVPSSGPPFSAYPAIYTGA